MGQKARNTCSTASQASHVSISNQECTTDTALLDREEDCPPKLCRHDLKDPERFHQRLVDWLMKQH